MWKTVYIATNSKIAETLTEYLKSEGVLVRTNTICALPKNNPYIEILVPASETPDALELLNNRLGKTLKEKFPQF